MRLKKHNGLKKGVMRENYTLGRNGRGALLDEGFLEPSSVAKSYAVYANSAAAGINDAYVLESNFGEVPCAALGVGSDICVLDDPELFEVILFAVFRVSFPA
ncbi:MAG: hypothetical protein Q8R79_09045 [Legionellaceae bacterium]|nr:hypothetical protein [Legionellaceae bacterium]